jgi:hypothetical protein
MAVLWREPKRGARASSSNRPDGIEEILRFERLFRFGRAEFMAADIPSAGLPIQPEVRDYTRRDFPY